MLKYDIRIYSNVNFKGTGVKNNTSNEACSRKTQRRVTKLKE